jgi:prephenate dehydrogenase
MKFKNISIIGVGLIGSSLALALKKNGYTGRITGIGRNRGNLIRAQRRGIIDTYTTDHSKGTKDADLIVFASFVGQFERIAKRIMGSIKKGAIVTDVGSVKVEIVRKMEPMMPDGVSFVGAHPIAGKECSGMDCATPTLFRKAKCIVTPGPKTAKKAVHAIIGLWKSVGSETVLMSPEQHDRIFAAVSHAPHVIAYSLVNAIADSDRNILPYGGKGLKDTTRIALSPAEMWRDICFSNKKEVLRILRGFESTLSRMTRLMEKSDWSSLKKEFARAQKARKLIESD